MGDWVDHPRVPGWSRRRWQKQQQRTQWPFLTSQQVELFKEVFDIFDGDGKGFFTAEELMEVMTMMGGTPTPLEVEGVLYEMDANNDRMVDFTEFLTKFYNCMSEQQILSVFNQLAIQQETESGNKVLTMSVLEKCFSYVGDPLSDVDKKFLDIMFQGADKDGNGTLDINEFLTYIERLEDDMAGPGDGQRLSDTLLMQQELRGSRRMSNSLHRRNEPVKSPSLLGKVTEWGLMGSRPLNSSGRHMVSSDGGVQRTSSSNIRGGGMLHENSLTREPLARGSGSTRPLLANLTAAPALSSGEASQSGRLTRLKNVSAAPGPQSPTKSRLQLEPTSSTQPLLQSQDEASYDTTLVVGAPASPSRAVLQEH